MPVPEISPAAIAQRVGISVRTLHGLLEATEASFSERVRDLRLAKAFGLLQDERGSFRKITDAAYEAGFSDLSYFNRSFKRKYGITPTAARGRREEKSTPQAHRLGADTITRRAGDDKIDWQQRLV